MKALSRKTSVESSPHPKRQHNVEIAAATLDEPKSRDLSFRGRCLRRDSFRCVISGEMDTSHWMKIGRPKDENTGPVEAAHVIPYAYASWNKSSVINP